LYLRKKADKAIVSYPNKKKCKWEKSDARVLQSASTKAGRIEK